MTTTLVQFNPDQEEITLIRKTIAPTVTPDEFKLFIEACKHYGLNPLARQIYAISRYDFQVQGNKMSIQTSIDGYRLLAERSGKYAGQLGPFWCGEDGQWVDVWVKSTPPVAARVGILRSDFKEPIWAVAKYESYAQKKKDGTPTSMWLKMPDVMLAKCAESLGLRRAFPAELSGLYTSEEMAQADNPLDQARVVEADSQSEQQAPDLAAIYALCDEVYGPGKWTKVKAMKFNPEQYGDLPDEMMSADQRQSMWNALMARKEKLAAQPTAKSAA